MWNYYDLAKEIMEQIKDVEKLANEISPPEDTLDYESVMEYAAEIVSETSGLYTCNIAYKHEPVIVNLVGPRRKKMGSRLIVNWIKFGDSLTDEYFDRGLEVVMAQYVRAGVRLGELLNAIAIQYFQSKQQVKTTKSGKDTKASVNIFSLLDAGSDPDHDEDISDKELDEMDKELEPVHQVYKTSPGNQPIKKNGVLEAGKTKKKNY